MRTYQLRETESSRAVAGLQTACVLRRNFSLCHWLVSGYSVLQFDALFFFSFLLFLLFFTPPNFLFTLVSFILC
jgi:hypothetical protein